jgi:hypothetical protein
MIPISRRLIIPNIRLFIHPVTNGLPTQGYDPTLRISQTTALKPQFNAKAQRRHDAK